MRIIVAIDESDQGKMLIHDIAQRCWKPETEFMILNVIESPAFDFGADFNEDTAEQLKVKLKETSDDLLEHAASYLNENLSSPCTVHKASAKGKPADAIVKVATDWGADLVIVGSHGRHGLAKFFLGSVAESVVVHAPCSVEIIRNEQVPQKTQKRKRSVVLY